MKTKAGMCSPCYKTIIHAVSSSDRNPWDKAIGLTSYFNFQHNVDRERKHQQEQESRLCSCGVSSEGFLWHFHWETSWQSCILRAVVISLSTHKCLWFFALTCSSRQQWHLEKNIFHFETNYRKDPEELLAHEWADLHLTWKQIVCSTYAGLDPKSPRLQY